MRNWLTVAEGAECSGVSRDTIYTTCDRPRWTSENRQLIDGQIRQFLERPRSIKFYFVVSSVRKSVWTLVRQLRGPHLSTCA
jgi:hypothetical protein